MNNIKKSFSILIALVLVISCSVGVKKDLLSGLSIKYNGFSIQDAFLVKDSTKTKDVKIKPGQHISMMFTGIIGFTDVNGNVFPGASILVTDSKGKTILEIADLFTAYDSTGVNIAMATEAISIEFTAPATGYAKGEKFNWKSKVWDKKGKSTLDCELQLEVEK